MYSNPASRATLEQALARHGLRLRGGWAPRAGDSLPRLPHGRLPAVVWMAGQVGSECWGAFSASPFFNDGLPDAMDRWSKSIGDGLAQQFGGVAIYPPDGPPFHPFQHWAQRAEPLQISPLLLQIHPQYGLWHAYRFALALPDLAPDDSAAIMPVAPVATPDLCLQCDGQPCLSACPVDAFTASSYEIERCSAHLHGPDGNTCMQTGCRARHACPVGGAYRYRPEHAAFHMVAFAQRR